MHISGGKWRHRITLCSRTWTEVWRATYLPLAIAKTIMNQTARHPQRKISKQESKAAPRSAYSSSLIYKKTNQPFRRSHRRQWWVAPIAVSDLQAILRVLFSTIRERRKFKVAKLQKLGANSVKLCKSTHPRWCLRRASKMLAAHIQPWTTRHQSHFPG